MCVCVMEYSVQFSRSVVSDSLLSHKKEQLFNPMETSNSLIPSPC